MTDEKYQLEWDPRESLRMWGTSEPGDEETVMELYSRLMNNEDHICFQNIFLVKFDISDFDQVPDMTYQIVVYSELLALIKITVTYNLFLYPLDVANNFWSDFFYLEGIIVLC